MKPTEEVNKIKKLLPNMLSSDIELVIQEAVRYLKINAYKEADRMFRLSVSPETIKLLKKRLNEK